MFISPSVFEYQSVQFNEVLHAFIWNTDIVIKSLTEKKVIYKQTKKLHNHIVFSLFLGRISEACCMLNVYARFI